MHIANAHLALYEEKYNRAFCQFKIADGLYSDARTKDLRDQAKKLLDEDRQRKWDEEYAKAITENGKYWDQWEKENLNLTSNDCE